MRDYREQNARGGRRVVHVFVTARGEGDEQQRVEREAAAFGDLLQKDVADSYFSHTRKVLALYEWLARRCGRARWLLKGDDDVFVNVRVLLRDLQSLEADQDEGALYSTRGCAICTCSYVAYSDKVLYCSSVSTPLFLAIHLSSKLT